MTIREEVTRAAVVGVDVASSPRDVAHVRLLNTDLPALVILLRSQRLAARDDQGIRPCPGLAVLALQLNTILLLRGGEEQTLLEGEVRGNRLAGERRLGLTTGNIRRSCDEFAGDIGRAPGRYP